MDSDTNESQECIVIDIGFELRSGNDVLQLQILMKIRIW